MTNLKTHLFSLLILVVLFSCSSDTNEVPEPEIVPIQAQFSQSSTRISINETVNFTDTSTGDPTNWAWTFEGGNPATSAQQNPSVLYESAGVYNVQLVASKDNSTDEIIKQGTVTVEVDLATGLILQVLLNGDAADTSGNELDGEIIGVVNPTTNRNNETNAAMLFNESDGHINFGSIPELEIDYDSTISIAVWINPNGNQVGWDTILNQFFEGPSPSAPGRFYLGLNPSNQRVRWNILENQLESSNAIPVNEWTHIVVTYDDRKALMYVNGELDGELTFGPEFFTFGSGAPFKIGEQSLTIEATTGFSGAIDDINIFDRLLEAGEVQALFNEN